MPNQQSHIDYKTIVSILTQELVPAAGCTEPIAIAYAAAVARKHMKSFPISAHTICSKNIIKNETIIIVSIINVNSTMF